MKTDDHQQAMDPPPYRECDPEVQNTGVSCEAPASQHVDEAAARGLSAKEDEDHPECMVPLPTSQIPADGSGRAALVEGSPVQLRFDASHAGAIGGPVRAVSSPMLDGGVKSDASVVAGQRDVGASMPSSHGSTLVDTLRAQVAELHGMEMQLATETEYLSAQIAYMAGAYVSKEILIASLTRELRNRWTH